MKKLLNLLLVLTSLLGYLEWGVDNSTFLFQAEYEVVIKIFTDPGSVMHPFVILPMLGQLLLLITLFQQEPSKRLTLIGIGCIGLLLGLMFIIGLIGPDIKILLSTVPFMLTATSVVMKFRKGKAS